MHRSGLSLVDAIMSIHEIEHMAKTTSLRQVQPRKIGGRNKRGDNHKRKHTPKRADASDVRDPR